jgi:hypothetical protein
VRGHIGWFIFPDPFSDIQWDLAIGATYYLGYCPVWKMTPSKADFLKEMQKPEYKILYFVFLVSCYSANAFPNVINSTSFLGYSGFVWSFVSYWFDVAFWPYVCGGRRTVKEAMDYGKKFVAKDFPPKWLPIVCIRGEGVVLRRW